MDATVVEVGYGIAAVAFLALFVLTGLSKIRSRQRLILLIVTGVNFVWALSIACSALIALPAWLLRPGRGRENRELAGLHHRPAWACFGRVRRNSGS